MDFGILVLFPTYPLIDVILFACAIYSSTLEVAGCGGICIAPLVLNLCWFQVLSHMLQSEHKEGNQNK